MSTEPITARDLPSAEWPDTLKHTPLATRPLDPRFSKVVVVERGGQVIACIAALTIVHAEGLWIAPEARNHGGVGRALLAALLEVLVKEEVPEVLSQSVSSETDQFFERVGGTPLEGTCYVIPVTPPEAEEIH